MFHTINSLIRLIYVNTKEIIQSQIKLVNAEPQRSEVGQESIDMYFANEKPPHICGRLCLGYLSSCISQVLSCRQNMPVACFRQEKSPDISVEAWCSRYGSIPGRPTYCRGVGTVRWTVPATMFMSINRKRTKPKLGS